jgi:hypothetical protein
VGVVAAIAGVGVVEATCVVGAGGADAAGAGLGAAAAGLGLAAVVEGAGAGLAGGVEGAGALGGTGAAAAAVCGGDAGVLGWGGVEGGGEGAAMAVWPAPGPDRRTMLGMGALGGLGAGGGGAADGGGEEAVCVGAVVPSEAACNGCDRGALAAVCFGGFGGFSVAARAGLGLAAGSRLVLALRCDVLVAAGSSAA